MNLKFTLERSDAKDAGDTAAFAFHGIKTALIENHHPVSQASDAKLFSEQWVSGQLAITTVRDLDLKEPGAPNIVGVQGYYIGRSVFGVTIASPLGVFIMPQYRGKGLVGQLQDFTCEKMADLNAHVALHVCTKDGPLHKFLETERGVDFRFVLGYRDIRKRTDGS